MRLLNLAALGIIFITWCVRFYYFAEHEEVKEVEVDDTTATAVNASLATTGLATNSNTYLKTVSMETVVTQDGFWLVFYTLIVFPVLMFVFLFQELQVQKLDFIGRNFYFLDYYIGKGMYLLLCVGLILQH